MLELWCWRRLLRVPWTARRSDQSILRKISPEYSLEGLMLKLKLQYCGHLMQRTDSLEKTLMLGKIEGRRRGRQDEMVGWHYWLYRCEFAEAPAAGDGQGSWHTTVHGLQRVQHDMNWTVKCDEEIWWCTEPWMISWNYCLFYEYNNGIVARKSPYY